MKKNGESYWYNNQNILQFCNGLENIFDQVECPEFEDVFGSFLSQSHKEIGFESISEINQSILFDNEICYEDSNVVDELIIKSRHQEIGFDSFLKTEKRKLSISSNDICSDPKNQHQNSENANYIFMSIVNIDINVKSILDLLGNKWISDTIIEAFMISLTDENFSYIHFAKGLVF